MKNILGISAFFHDSAAALTINGKIIAAAQEERFTRVKNTSIFPVNAIKYCLEEGGLQLDDLDAVVFYEKPFLKFERLLQTYYEFAPRGLISFLKAMPIWLKEKLFIKTMIYNGLKNVGSYNKNKLNLLFSDHHLSHAASTFFSSPFEEAAILTIDSVGEWCTASICIGSKNKIKVIKEMNFPHSVGLLYSSFTYYLGFKVNSGEYKLMGLAPFGNELSDETKEFIRIIKTDLIDIKSDGSIWLNQRYFTYATGLRMVNDQKWEKLFGFKRRSEESELEQKHCNLAYAIQSVTEEIVIRMVKEAKIISNSDNLCMAGGVALNCVANGKLTKHEIFSNIYVQPASGDAGGSIGSALAAHYIYFGLKRKPDTSNDEMSGSYLGPEFSEKEIQLMNKTTKAVFKKYDNINDLTDFVASKLSSGNVIGWFQGRMEFGPRSLGNRSILGDARNINMHQKLNLKIKYREGFRPFASSVLFENLSDYFDTKTSSPYMLFTSSIKDEYRRILPDNYYDLSPIERINYNRSEFQSVIHVDFSSRIQTVHKETNYRYWNLLNAFKKMTNCGILINTSFNIRGEPIVCTPFDAYRCFMSTEMDYLVIGDFIYFKKEQSDWNVKSKWLVNYNKD